MTKCDCRSSVAVAFQATRTLRRAKRLQAGAHSLDTLPGRFRIADRSDRRAFANALHQTGQNSARSQLNEKVAAARQDPLDAIVPAQRGRHLFLQSAANLR